MAQQFVVVKTGDDIPYVKESKENNEDETLSVEEVKCGDDVPLGDKNNDNDDDLVSVVKVIKDDDVVLVNENQDSNEDDTISIEEINSDDENPFVDQDQDSIENDPDENVSVVKVKCGEDVPLVKENDDIEDEQKELQCEERKLKDLKTLFRGYCLVIDNISKPNTDDKVNNPGEDKPNNEQSAEMTALNKQNIEHIFGKMFGFHVQYYTQLTVSAIKQLLFLMSQIDHSNFTSLVIIMLCRGCGESVYCANFDKTKEKIELNEIASYFSDKSCPSLMDKPVILLHDIWQQEASTLELQDIWQQASSWGSALFGGDVKNNSNDVPTISNLYRVVCHSPEVFQKDNGVSLFIKLLCQEVEVGPDVSFNAVLSHTISLLKLEERITVTTVKHYGDSDYCYYPLPPLTLREEAFRLSGELQMALDVWLPMRRNVIEELEAKKEKIMEVCRNVRISRIAGGAVGVTGGLMTLAGFALIPFTFGSSLALTGIGTSIAVAGGVTTVGATIADLVISKKELREASDLLTLDRQLCQVMNSLRESMQKIAKKIGDKTSRVKLSKVEGLAAFEGSMFAVRLVTGIAAKGIATVGLSAVIIPLDIYEIVSNYAELNQNSPTAASKWLQEQIDFLKSQEEEIKKIQEAEHHVEEKAVFDLC